MFIALHIGAGYHSSSNEKQYKLVCKQACSIGTKLLREGKNSRTVVKNVCSFLEDSPFTNAGYGSNLNINGHVECDAAVMESVAGGFAGVGCVRDVKNPIQLALHMLTVHNIDNVLVPPLMIAGEAAKVKAASIGLEVVDNRQLVSPKSLQNFNHYKRKIDDGQSNAFTAKRPCTEFTCKQDTIGVLCIDSDGVLVAGVSSGGIALKQPGRVGHAPHFGCGCWSLRYTPMTTIGCCTSGTGEQLIRTSLAKELSDYCFSLGENPFLDLNSIVEKKFLNSPLLMNDSHPRYCGMLLAKHIKMEGQCPEVDLYLAHTSPSFCYGYMDGQMKKPRSFISRLNKDMAGTKVVSQAFHFKL